MSHQAARRVNPFSYLSPDTNHSRWHTAHRWPAWVMLCTVNIAVQNALSPALNVVLCICWGPERNSRGPWLKELAIFWGPVCWGPTSAEGGACALDPPPCPPSPASSALHVRVPHHGPHFLFYLSDCELKLGKLTSCVPSLSPGKHMKDDRYCEFSPHSHCEGNERLELWRTCPPKVWGPFPGALSPQPHP